jgi:hypothetical protein
MMWLLVSGFPSNLLDAASVEAFHPLYNGSESTRQVDVTPASKLAVEDLPVVSEAIQWCAATRRAYSGEKPDAR